MSQAQYTEQITRLIEQQGAARARQAEQSGAIWGGALASLGQIPAQMQQQKIRQQEQTLRGQEIGLRGQELEQRTKAFAQELIDKKQQHDDQAIGQAGSFIHESGNTIEALQSGLAGLVKAGLMSDAEAQPILAGAQEDPNRVKLLARGMMARTKEGRDRLEKVTKYGPGDVGIGFDGKEVVRVPESRKTPAELAADAANPTSPTQAQSTTALDLMRPPKEAPKPPAAGSFEDYVIRGAKEKGKAPEELSPADIEGMRKAYQQADDRPRITVNTGDARKDRRVDARTKAFESLPIVKRTVTASEAVGFANSLDPKTKNPADDQGLIYAFAKAMDPDSVVREGEYATVQKYAQSWAQSYGFNAARIFSNTTFLTEEARRNMKATIQAKFEATKKQYEAAHSSFVNQINHITGEKNGAEYLTDFGTAFPTVAANTKPGQQAAPANGPAVGETRTYQGETRRWNGQKWEPVK